MLKIIGVINDNITDTKKKARQGSIWMRIKGGTNRQIVSL